jgi:hypothetical protein
VAPASDSSSVCGCSPIRYVLFLVSTQRPCFDPRASTSRRSLAIPHVRMNNDAKRGNATTVCHCQFALRRINFYISRPPVPRCPCDSLTMRRRRSTTMEGNRQCLAWQRVDPCLNREDLREGQAWACFPAQRSRALLRLDNGLVCQAVQIVCRQQEERRARRSATAGSAARQ